MASNLSEYLNIGTSNGGGGGKKGGNMTLLLIVACVGFVCVSLSCGVFLWLNNKDKKK